VVNVKREANNKVTLSQERFIINFRDNANLTWKIPLTYLIDGQSAAATLLISEKAVTLEDVPADRALKLNVEGAGNYRVAYDEASWKLLLATLPGMNVPDQVNLLSDAWAFVQEGRKPLSFYTDLVDRLSASTALAVREQIINAFNSIDHLLVGTSEQETFRHYARGVLRPTLDALGLQPKAEEPVTASLLRTSLLQQLGLFGDEDVIKTCRQNFDNYLKNPGSIPPDLRAPTFAIVMRYGDATIWQKLHELGLKTASTEDKQYYYDALAFATDPKLIQKSLAITLTDELPTSRATFMVPKVARESDRPDLAWEFAKKNLKPLVAKVDALNANSYLPSLFSFFFDSARIEELKAFAKKNLSEASRKPVEIASDEIQFRADFRKRLIEEIAKQ
jgi:aminopeptidase N